MSGSPHVPPEVLAEFLDAPGDSRHRETALHLATCRSCAAAADSLWRLREELRHRPPGAAGEAEHDAEVHAAVDAALDGARASLRETVGADRGRQRAALHYALQQIGNRRATSADGVPESRWVAARRAADWLAGLASWRAPVWAAAAIAMLVVAGTVVWQQPGTPGLRVALYQDAAVVRFAVAPTPGIGFFGAAREDTAPFEGVRMTLADGGLRLSWPPVAGATHYTASLYRAGENGRVALGEVAAKGNAAEFRGLSLEPGRRYLWEIAGATGDGRRFTAAGGFVVHDE